MLELWRESAIHVNTFRRQNEVILSLIANIRDAVRLVSLENAADDLAIQISMLAGKIRAHLNYEVKYLFPFLLENGDDALKEEAKCFMDEVESTGQLFNAYKKRYNTKFKILADTVGFLKATEETLYSLEKRIEKEDKILYTLFKQGY